MIQLLTILILYFAGPSAASIVAFDEILNGPFRTYLELSKKIGSEVATISEMVETAFKAQRSYLEMATKAKQPSQGELPMLLKPMSDKISEIEAYRESGRRSQFFNHLSAISESIAGYNLYINTIFSEILKSSCRYERWKKIFHEKKDWINFLFL